VVVGRVLTVSAHPFADAIRLAEVDLGDGQPVQIVFGGPDVVVKGDLVPVAPPGSHVPKGKMRRRRYRGELSHGMLCSLDELGWTRSAPDQVAVLRNVTPGDNLDNRPDWVSLVASPLVEPAWIVDAPTVEFAGAENSA
jgi:phenylalanyl-tRNA synthetase beta chain